MKTMTLTIALTVAAVGGILLGIAGLLLWFWWHQAKPTPAPAITLALAKPALQGRLNEIQASTVSGVTALTWSVLSAPNNVQYPADYDFSPEGVAADLVSPIPGDYRVECLGVLNSAPVKADLVVTIPGSGPGPTPPIPDVLQQALQTAYAAEADPSKATLKTSLAGVYTQAAKDAADPSVGTWGALFTKRQDNITAAGLAGKLPSVKAVIGAELLKALPFAENQSLDAAGRQQGAAEFTKVATALGKVQ